MKKLFITLIVSVLFLTGISAQSIANYTFSTSTNAVLQDLSSGSTQLIGPSSIDVASSITDIGFPFYFMGVPYTQFSVNSNGQMGLGGTVFSGTGISNAAANAPLIVPVSGSNTLLSTGQVHYKITGTAPNRILIVEWKDLLIPTPVVDSDPPTVENNPNQIQVVLHESTGIIEFNYGLISYTSAPTINKATFISSGNTATTVKSIAPDMVNANNAYPIGNYVLNSTNINLLNNRQYSFTPPIALTAPTWDTTNPFRSVTTTGLILNWVNHAPNQTSINIYRSDDAGLNYVFVSSLNTFATNYEATLPFPGISSLWKIAAVNEGTASFSSANSPLTVPVVSVADCGGTSTLTASNYTGTLLWSTGETTPSIIVSANGIYSVSQTLAGLTSVAGSGVATPQPTVTGPVDPVTLLPATLTSTNIGLRGYKTEPGMSGYKWNVSGGKTFTGQETDSITVDWNNVSGQQTVSVQYINPNCSTLTPLTVLIINYFPFATNIDPTTIPQFVDPMPHFAAGLRVNAKAGGDLLVKTVKVQQVALSTGTMTANGKIGDPKTPTAGLGNYAAYAISYKGGAFGPAMWPAQTIEAQQGNELRVQYENDLVGVKYSDFNILADQTLLMNGYKLNGDPLIDPYTGDIPMVVHLHGGEMPSNSDGGPTAWFMPTGNDLKGPGFKFNASSLSTYPNKQEATTCWYHPHDQGLTRINVYTGLAGYYFIRGAAEETAKLPGWSGDDKVQEVTPLGKTPTFNGTNTYLPEIELAVQDRMFNVNGELYWPVAPTNPDLHPFWTPEFFGDVMTVNGKSWPYLSVAPRKYRFRMLDGCNARFLNMWLMNLATQSNGPKVTVIGTDGGLLDAPVDLDPSNGKTVFMAPGERLDVVIDFSGVAPGTVFTLMNDAAAPYPTGSPVTAGLTDRIMQFVVNGNLIAADGTSVPKDKSLLAANLRVNNPMVKLTDFNGNLANGIKPVIKRQILLNEVTGPGGPAQVLFNNSHFDEGAPSVGTPAGFGGPTEMPLEGTTELIQIINTTIDAHPIHIHLLQWQLVSRRAFNRTDYLTAYNNAWAAHIPSVPIWPAGLGYPGGAGSPFPYLTPNADGAVGGNPAITPYLTGPVIPANPEENGWKDDIKAFPGQVSTFIVRVAPTDKPINSPQSDLVLPFDPSIGPGYVWHCHIIDHEDMDMMRPLMIQPTALRFPQIKSQPQAVEACIGNIVVFPLTATTGPEAPISYQWQVSTNGGNDYLNLTEGVPYTGTLTSSLSVNLNSIGLSSNLYQAVLTNVDGVTISNSAMLKVVPANSTPLVSINASATSVFAGQLVTFTPVPTFGGTSPTYEWFKNNVSVATTPTYTYTPVNADAVHVVMTSSAPCAIGGPVTSSNIPMTVNNTASTGLGDGDWNSTATWPNGQIPGSTSNVVIPQGTTIIIQNGTPAICKTLFVEGKLTSGTGSNTLTIAGDLTLDGTLITGPNTVFLKGNTLGTGIISAVSGTLVYDGSMAQTVSNTDSTDIINNLIIDNKVGVTLPDDLTVGGTLTINAGSKLTNPNGAILTVNNVMINSDIPSGPGTFVDNGNTYTNTGGVSNVQQYLTGGRNWYVSSPVTTATPGSISTATSIYSYNEPTAEWNLESSTLSVLKGYAAGIQSNGTVTFTGGALNTGVPENSWLTNTGGSKSGFNLVGNPYPSFLNFDLVYPSSTNLDPTMWYRTQNAGNTAYVFDTYNAYYHIGTANNGVKVTSMIPPVQSFWVQVSTGYASGILGINNSMRSHDVATNRLKAKTQVISAQQLLRLQVSNGVNSDEAIVVFNSNASNEFDKFDSPKMTNNLAYVPELYTLAGTEQLVINGLNNVSSIEELPLGFTSGEKNTFTIKAMEINNFDTDTKIVLKDKLLSTEKELVVGNNYTFSSEAINTSTRFSILFKSTAITTGINPVNGTGTESMFLFKNQNNQISVHRNDPVGEGTVTVYSAIGQKIVTIPTTGAITLVPEKLLSGVYMITVNVQGKNTTKKITL